MKSHTLPTKVDEVKQKRKQRTKKQGVMKQETFLNLVATIT